MRANDVPCRGLHRICRGLYLFFQLCDLRIQPPTEPARTLITSRTFEVASKHPPRLKPLSVTQKGPRSTPVTKHKCPTCYECALFQRFPSFCTPTASLPSHTSDRSSTTQKQKYYPGNSRTRRQPRSHLFLLTQQGPRVVASGFLNFTPHNLQLLLEPLALLASKRCFFQGLL